MVDPILVENILFACTTCAMLVILCIMKYHSALPEVMLVILCIMKYRSVLPEVMLVILCIIVIVNTSFRRNGQGQRTNSARTNCIMLVLQWKAQLGFSMPLFLPSFLLFVVVLSKHNSWAFIETIVQFGEVSNFFSQGTMFKMPRPKEMANAASTGAHRLHTRKSRDF
jgi:hypothetical protein